MLSEYQIMQDKDGTYRLLHDAGFEINLAHRGKTILECWRWLLWIKLQTFEVGESYEAWKTNRKS